jgi:hypothetical protein
MFIDCDTFLKDEKMIVEFLELVVKLQILVRKVKYSQAYNWICSMKASSKEAHEWIRTRQCLEVIAR